MRLRNRRNDEKYSYPKRVEEGGQERLRYEAGRRILGEAYRDRTFFKNQEFFQRCGSVAQRDCRTKTAHGNRRGYSISEHQQQGASIGNNERNHTFGYEMKEVDMEALGKQGCCGKHHHGHHHHHGDSGCGGHHAEAVSTQSGEQESCHETHRESADDGEDDHSGTASGIHLREHAACCADHPQAVATSEHHHPHEEAGCGCGGHSSSHDHSHHDHAGGDCGCGHDHAAVNVDYLAIALLLFGLGMAAEKLQVAVAGLPSSLIAILLMTASYLLSGYQTILAAFRNIGRGEIFDENFLMTIATFGAIGIGEYPEAAAVMLFYQVGEYFQGRAVARSRGSIAELMDIRPDFANRRKADGSIEVVAPERLRVDDVIVIKSGEKVPVDCVIIEGRTTIDNAALTGESIPVEKSVDERLMSGSINLTGLVSARVEKEFGESTVSKILELVQNASEKKSNRERFITRFARYYTPIVVLLAVLIMAIPPIFLAEPFAKWFSRALVFLVISCPCALVISVPLSFFAGIGGASKKGILFKGSGYVEQLSQVKSILFDKTGTLTRGHFEVAEIVPAGGITRDRLLELAAYAEKNSNHPIAKSIVGAYRSEQSAHFDEKKVGAVEEISGFGVRAVIDGDVILAGNRKLMEGEGIEIPTVDRTTVYFAQNGRSVGYITVEDKLKSDSVEAIRKLNRMGVETTILTGDNQHIAERVASELGVTKYFAELLPQGKVEKTEEELARYEKSTDRVAFVGDGINDAPVLARADIGIAMGGIGSDAAIEAADVVLMTDEPSKIAEAIRISKKTLSVATQNIWFALGVKIIVMMLGVVGIANMWLAVFADVGVSFLAVLNAMRAYRVE